MEAGSDETAETVALLHDTVDDDTPDWSCRRCGRDWRDWRNWSIER